MWCVCVCVWVGGCVGVGGCVWVLQIRELVDVATIADQEIENDAIIYMVFKKGGQCRSNKATFLVYSFLDFFCFIEFRNR